MKRIKLLPLAVLLWCAGISLSSGLYFYDIYSAVYLIPVALVMGAYYLLRALPVGSEKKELIGLGGAVMLSLLRFLLFKETVICGFGLLYNTVSHRIFVTYGLALGSFPLMDEGSVALAISQIVAFVTAFSLYLYETRRPAVVTVLPSFLLFTASIAADGVPYEACVIAYAGALIIFLGMGRRGESLSKFLLLFSCTAVTAAVVGFAFSWPDVSRHMWEYRNQITRVVSGSGNGSGASGETGSEPGMKDQKIDFQRFNKKGDISYNGTIELHVKSDEPCSGAQLFLCGFVAYNYEDNMWNGSWLSDDFGDDVLGNVFAWDSAPGIKVENAFDKGSFIPFTVRPENYEEWEDQKLLYVWKETAKQVEPELRKRIDKEIIQGKKCKTVGDVINIVKTYFSENFQYTLRPGELEDGEDEIEKFLFTRKTGYCTHFASAAVMIIKSMGIEARLAEGYMINGDRMQVGEQTDVYDYNAHAWTEIFVEGEIDGEYVYGWLPLDVTSYVLGDLTNGNPIGAEWADVEDARHPEQNQKKPEKKKAKKEKNEEETKEKDKESRERKGGFWNQAKDTARVFVEEKMTWETGIIILASVIFIGGVSFLTVILIRRRRYQRMKTQMRKGSFRKRLLFVNDSLGGFWREAGIPWDYSDSIAQTRNIWRKTGKYYPSPFKNSERRELIYQYVLSVYESRFGDEDMDKATYEADMGYLSELIHLIKKGTDKKKWKKFRKCSMVKIFEGMEDMT